MRTIKVITISLLAMLIPVVAQAGAWGAGSFENDDALEWAAHCTKLGDIAAVTEALNAALNARYIEAPEGSAAIAAAEVVAAAIGRPSKSLPPELVAWVKQLHSDKLAHLAPVAKRALIRVQDSKNSELYQLWSESKQNAWLTAITELSGRLDK